MPKVRDPEIVKFIEDCHFKKLQCQKGYEKYKKVFFNYETEIMPFVKWQALFYQIKKEHAGWWRKINSMSSKDIPEPTLTELFVVLRDINNRIENIQNSLPTSVYD